MDLRGQRPHAGVLVGQGEPRLPFVGGDEIEAFEVQDVAPAAGHLAVGDAEDALRDGRGEPWNRPPVEDPVAEVAEHDSAGRCGCDLRSDPVRSGIRDAAVVDRIHPQEAVVTAHDGVFVRGGPGAVDDRPAVHAEPLEILQHEVLERVVPQHGREHHLRAGRAEVGRDDGRSADVIDTVVEADARRRRLGHTADHRRVGQAVDDGVADDMHRHPTKLGQGIAKAANVIPSASIKTRSFSTARSGGPASMMADEE